MTEDGISAVGHEEENLPPPQPSREHNEKRRDVQDKATDHMHSRAVGWAISPRPCLLRLEWVRSLLDVIVLDEKKTLFHPYLGYDHKVVYEGAQYTESHQRRLLEWQTFSFYLVLQAAMETRNYMTSSDVAGKFQVKFSAVLS